MSEEEKKQLLESVSSMKDTVISVLIRIREGDMTYSEVGEYFHDDLGDSLVSAFENVENCLKADKVGGENNVQNRGSSFRKRIEERS